MSTAAAPERPVIGVPCRRGSHSKRPSYFNLASYCDTLATAGAIPVLLPLVEDEAVIAGYAERLDGLLLAGGGDVHPRSYGQPVRRRLRSVDRRMDRVEMALIRSCLNAGLPILGICRGAQMLNVALGGTLVQEIGSEVAETLPHLREDLPRHVTSHEVSLVPGTRLAELLGLGPLRVNSLHHQACDRLGAGLRVAGRAPDGIIEAIEHSERPFVVGVQWHPEELWREDSRYLALFQELVAGCRDRSGQRQE